MKIGAAVSAALLSLLEKNHVPIDYVEVNGEDEVGLLLRALTLCPVLLHDISNGFWLNYQDPFDPAIMARAREMIGLVHPPWFSTGIGASAEPQGHTTAFWRGAPTNALQPRELCLENIVRNGKRLAHWLDIPLLLENYNYHPTNAYEYVCDPAAYCRLLDEIGCDMLLDLAHAQISAFNLGWPSAQEYLSALPLDRVREIHINHPFNDAGKQLLDKHLPLQESDIPLLRWTLERAKNVKAITLESEPANEEGLIQELELLRQVK